MINSSCVGWGCSTPALREASLGALGLTNDLTGGQRAVLWAAAAVTVGAGVGAALSHRRRRGRDVVLGALTGLALGLLPAVALWRTE